MCDKSQKPNIQVKPSKMKLFSGAWKVAYADFVTAMMAFFLLMWLLNVTTKEQKNAISNYFDPTHPKVSTSESGAGGVMGGMTMSPEGAMASDKNPTIPPSEQYTYSPELQPEDPTEAEIDSEQLAETLREMEEERFEEVKDKIEQAIEESPELKDLASHILVDMTPEGLRIQIVDQKGASMFPLGSAEMFEKTKGLIRKVGDVIKEMPNKLSVRGHTDSLPYKSAKRPNYSNWELSSDRANSSRRVLLESGMPKDRIYNVQGKADTDLLKKDDPKHAQNRRISIVLMKEELTGGFKELKEDKPRKPRIKLPKVVYSGPEHLELKDYKKSDGEVKFP